MSDLITMKLNIMKNVVRFLVVSVILLPFSIGFASGKRSSVTAFSVWKSRYGKVIDMKSWNNENPRPYTSYFPSGKADSLRTWYVSLGPLGLHTIMHDRSWGDVFTG